MRKLLAFVLVASAGCAGEGASAPDSPGDPGSGKADEGGDGPARLQWCEGAEHAGTATGHWNHHSSSVWASLGHPRHVAQDVVGAPGGQVTVHGKFAYGATSKDLEDEWVSIFLDDCQGFRSAGRARTDDDGRMATDVDVSDLGPGVYALRFEVEADASAAEARLWLLPAGTHVVVSDIDGTLTTSDGELVLDLFADFFEPILAGDYVPRAYDGGPALMGAHAARGQLIVYLTGRPYWLTDTSRQWLDDLGFAPGILHTTDTSGEAFPANEGVGEFKRAYIEGLIEAGLVVDTAYGNASTDIYAYSGAGIPADDTWIIGVHEGEDGTHAAGDDWQARAADVSSEPAVEQPFAW